MPNAAESFSSQPEFFISKRGEPASKEGLRLIDSKKKKNADLDKITERLINKDEYKESYLNALRMKYGKDPDTAGSFAFYFAQVENAFVANCLGLEEEQIDKLVREFNFNF